MEYPTAQLIELAYSAYRVNKGYEKNTRRYSESQPTTFSNKELIAYTLTDGFKPEDFIPLQVTQEDLDAKAAGDKHMRRYTMLAMGDLPQFEADMFTAFCSEKMSVHRVGLIAYLPQFVNRELQTKIYKQRLKTEFVNSKYLTNNIIGECEILKVIRVSRDFEDPFYMHFGAIDGNLVCFAKKEGFAEGVVYQISAKVKGQEKERETGLPMTRINYVKLRKTEA